MATKNIRLKSSDPTITPKLEKWIRDWAMYRNQFQIIEDPEFGNWIEYWADVPIELIIITKVRWHEQGASSGDNRNYFICEMDLIT